MIITLTWHIYCFSHRKILLEVWCMELWGFEVGNIYRLRIFSFRGISLSPAGNKKRYQYHFPINASFFFLLRFLACYMLGFFVNHIKFYLLFIGYIMEKPHRAPRACYELMKMCWKFHPKDRCTFSEIKKKLKDIYESMWSSLLLVNMPFVWLLPEFF